MSRETAILYFVWTLNVFDPKLDHPEDDVINCINTRVNLNRRGRKHDKPRSNTLFCADFYEDVQTVCLFLNVSDPKSDHCEANVLKSVNIDVSLLPQIGNM